MADECATNKYSMYRSFCQFIFLNLYYICVVYIFCISDLTSNVKVTGNVHFLPWRKSCDVCVSVSRPKTRTGVFGLLTHITIAQTPSQTSASGCLAEICSTFHYTAQHSTIGCTHSYALLDITCKHSPGQTHTRTPAHPHTRTHR